MMLPVHRVYLVVVFMVAVGDGVSLAMMSWLCFKSCTAVPVCHESLKESVVVYPV